MHVMITRETMRNARGCYKWLEAVSSSFVVVFERNKIVKVVKAHIYSERIRTRYGRANIQQVKARSK